MKHILPFLCMATSFALTAHPPPEIKEILIRNTIKPKMLEYTFLKIGYSPDSFTLKVNDKELKAGHSMSLPADKQTVRIRYDYSFAKGWRTGAKEITFELDKQKKEYDLEFSWHNQWRVIAGGATPQRVERLKYRS